jgi:hypothetical protein
MQQHVGSSNMVLRRVLCLQLVHITATAIDVETQSSQPH